MNKREAIAVVSEKGFSEHYDTGQCGDGGYGTRLYYKRPEAELNKFGVPKEHATLSYLGASVGWIPQVFERKDSL